MKTTNRFAVGSGVFACGCCGRKTRSTGGDNDDLGLCEQCYDLAGYSNSVSDHGADSLTQRDRDEIASLLLELKTKGYSGAVAWEYPDVVPLP